MSQDLKKTEAEMKMGATKSAGRPGKPGQRSGAIRLGCLLVLLLAFPVLTGLWGACALAAGNTVPEELILPTEPDAVPVPDNSAMNSVYRQSRGFTLTWEYTTNDEGGVTILRYNGTDTEVTVPGSLGGKPVTRLYQTFYSNTAIESVVLPASVTHVDRMAFYGCTALKTVTGLEENSVIIGPHAFRGCSALTSFPVAEISGLSEWCFSYCYALAESYTITEVTEIPSSAFLECNALTGITLPEGLTTIAAQAFYNCSSLTELDLPDSLKEFGRIACYKMTSLSEIDVPDGVETFGESVFSRDTVMIVGEGTPAHQYALDLVYQKYKIRGEQSYDDIGAGATTVDEMVDAIVEALIRPEMTDYEKALALHDYLTRTANYDETLTRRTPEDILLGDRLGVCQAYAIAYRLLLDEVGIPNCYEYGNSHIWNMAELSGHWVHIDCTWDDPTGGGYENHTFFAVTNYALEGVRSHECTRKPHIAVEPTMSYAYRYNMLNSRISELTENLNRMLGSGLLSDSLSPASFRNGDSHGILNRLSIETVRNAGAAPYRDHDPIISAAHHINESGQTEIKTADISIDFDIPESRTLRLPAGLTELEGESLSGTAPEKIIFGSGVVSVADDFTEAEDRFLMIVAPKDSAAWKWAEDRYLPRKEPTLENP